MRDNRLVGATAENIFLSILNERGIFATSLDIVAFDGIVFDKDRRWFKVGESPFYVQIKCRGSESEHFNPQGHARNIVDGMLEVARELGIPETSLYFVVGFFRRGDIRTIVYYCVPLEELDRFRKTPTSQYRFSVERCEQEIEPEGGIFKI
jgi:hypothetical protein